MDRDMNNPRPRVLVVNASPGALDANCHRVSDLVEGFTSVLGAAEVAGTTIEFADQRVAESGPELVVVVGSCLPDCCDYSQLRHACDQAGCTLAFWMQEDPFEFDAHVKILDYADYIFTNDRWAAEHYVHPRVEHLPLAASPRRHALGASSSHSVPRHDVFYYGAGYENRKQVVRDLQSILAGVQAAVRGSQWGNEMPAMCRDMTIEDDALPAWYASARVVVNLPRDWHVANRNFLVPSTPGPETFAAAMAGACQMVFVNSLEVLDYFTLDKEVLLFDGPRDFQEQLMALLADPARCATIGAAARARCLRDHTYAARARRLLQCVGYPHTPLPAASSGAVPRPNLADRIGATAGNR